MRHSIPSFLALSLCLAITTAAAPEVARACGRYGSSQFSAEDQAANAAVQHVVQQALEPSSQGLEAWDTHVEGTHAVSVLRWGRRVYEVTMTLTDGLWIVERVARRSVTAAS
jgi:hypothetical protein